jgi:radical SAM-linked protein
MAAAALARYRVSFAKTEAMRFTGHLDLHRTWERTFRRAGLPLAYSEGFNPHPRVNIGAALPLGCLSRGDLIDAWLERELEPGEVEAALRRASPPGIDIEGVDRLDLAEPVLQSRIVSSRYEVTSAEFPPAGEMDRRIAALLRSPDLPRLRRGKPYDLRPRIEELAYDPAQSVLEMRLSAREGAVGRPEEVVQALGLDPALATAVRTELTLTGEQPEPVERAPH